MPGDDLAARACKMCGGLIDRECVDTHHSFDRTDLLDSLGWPRGRCGGRENRSGHGCVERELSRWCGNGLSRSLKFRTQPANDAALLFFDAFVVQRDQPVEDLGVAHWPRQAVCSRDKGVEFVVDVSEDTDERTTLTTHLLTVWNPTYEADALQLHLEVLLATMREAREGNRDHDDVFVWWGKVRSVNRQAPLPHLQDVLAVDAQIETDDADAPEVQIYLTDYRSLYVAHVGAVKSGSDFTLDAQVPAYYAARGLKCDCWFMLWDIRQLVWDDTTAVATTLATLRNTRSNDRPVSIYGGVVDLPLLVTCADDTRWFEDATRERYTGGRFWAESDAEQRGVGEMQRELRLNRFGTAAWTAFDTGVRRFIASAEATFRTHCDDMAFELSPVIVSLASGMEVQVNLLLRVAMRGEPADVRFTNIDGQSVDLALSGALSLGALARAIPETKARCDWLRSKLEQGEWFVTSLPPILAELAEQRNDAAHGKGVPREAVMRVRERLVGVGLVGVLVHLARVIVR